MTPTTDFSYAFDEIAGEFVHSILFTIPARWGRMPPLSRAVVVETAILLRQNGLLQEKKSQKEMGRTIGLIGGSRWGSLTTDLAFARSMEEDIHLASPALFGYTLANTPLAEAANQFGLTGPVYALIAPENPLEHAQKEASSLLDMTENLDMMLACEFDAYYRSESVEQLSVTFTLVEKHD